MLDRSCFERPPLPPAAGGRRRCAPRTPPRHSRIGQHRPRTFWQAATDAPVTAGLTYARRSSPEQRQSEASKNETAIALIANSRQHQAAHRAQANLGQADAATAARLWHARSGAAFGTAEGGTKHRLAAMPKVKRRSRPISRVLSWTVIRLGATSP